MIGPSHRRKYRVEGAAGICVAVALGLSASGCSIRTRAPTAASEIKVTLSVPILEMDAPDESSSRAEAAMIDFPESISAEGVGAYPTQSSGSVQRMAVARAEARRDALRKLAVALVRHSPEEGPSLGERLADARDGEAKLRDHLETHAEVTYRGETDRVIAKATVAGATLGPALGLNASESAGTEQGESEEEIEVRREAARTLGVDMARRQILERILRISDGRRIGSRYRRDRAFASALDAMIESTEPDEVVYTEDGKCRVTVSFDPSRLDELDR